MHIIRKSVKNIDEITWDFTCLEQQFSDLAGEALMASADLVMAKADIQVPVETGLLKASGDKDTPLKMPGFTSISFGYNTSYAVFVHEIPAPAYSGFLKGWGNTRTTAKIKWNMQKELRPQLSAPSMSRTAMHKPPTKWKFLEDPVNWYEMEPLEQLVKLVDDLIINSSGKFVPPPPSGPTYQYGRFAGMYEGYGEAPSPFFKDIPHASPSEGAAG